jgi:hypothetical protein
MLLRGAFVATKQSPHHAGDCFGQEQERPRNDMDLTSRQLLQFIKQLTPLNLGNPKLLADLIGLHASMKICQCAGPAAHIEREMFRQPGFVADILEQIF